MDRPPSKTPDRCPPDLLINQDWWRLARAAEGVWRGGAGSGQAGTAAQDMDVSLGLWAHSLLPSNHKQLRQAERMVEAGLRTGGAERSGSIVATDRLEGEGGNADSLHGIQLDVEKTAETFV